MRPYEGTYVVLGPPGTGKTTDLAKQVDAIIRKLPGRRDGSSPVSVCSLTRAAAAEIASRQLGLPRDQIGTLHSLAYRAVGGGDVAEVHIQEWNLRHSSPGMQVSADYPHHDHDDLKTEERAPATTGDANYAQYSLRRAMMQNESVWPVTLRAWAKKWEQWKKDNGYIDYQDMIDIAAEETSAAPGRPDVLIVDEAQDLSRSEWRLLQKWEEAAGALIFAGDDRQALYVWRGAAPEVFADPAIRPDHRRQLHQSYRVPRQVRDAANLWAKRYLSTYQEVEYRPRAGDDGEVRYQYNADWRRPSAIVDQVEKHLADGESAMIAASCAYMLHETVKELKRRSVPFSNPWRVKNGAWNPYGGAIDPESNRKKTTMRDRLLALLTIDRGTFGEKARPWQWGDLERWAAAVRASNVFRRGAKKLLGMKPEYADVEPDDLINLFEEEEHLRLMVALGENDEGRGRRLIDWYETVLIKSREAGFAYPASISRARGTAELNAEPRVYVGTIHSFKGSESDHVYLYPDLSPAGYRNWAGNLLARDAVTRQFYVGMTRAVKTLSFAAPASDRLCVPLRKAKP